MKILGIDYGSKRTGLSLSDEGGRVAFPYSVISSSLDEIFKIIEKEKVDEVVIGESRDFNMKNNEIMKDINSLKSSLEEKGVRVFLHPELLSTHQVSVETFESTRKENNRKVNKKDFMLDAKAATIILQDYIDKKNI